MCCETAIAEPRGNTLRDGSTRAHVSLPDVPPAPLVWMAASACRAGAVLFDHSSRCFASFVGDRGGQRRHQRLVARERLRLPGAKSFTSTTPAMNPPMCAMKATPPPDWGPCPITPNALIS